MCVCVCVSERERIITTGDSESRFESTKGKILSRPGDKNGVVFSLLPEFRPLVTLHYVRK